MANKPIVKAEDLPSKKPLVKAAEEAAAKEPVTSAEEAPAKTPAAKKPAAKTENVLASQSATSFVATQEAKDRATTKRVIAVILWVLGLACEAAAIYLLLKRVLDFQSALGWVILIGLIVADLILVLVGSMFWKKANRLDPASIKNKFRFFVQNQLGVIISVIAFLPLVVIIFTDKNLSGKQKGILGAVAAVALVAAGLGSADFNPPSVEQYTDQINQVETLTGQNLVYWTASGTKYHLYADCYTINTDKTTEIISGTVQQARELKNITELCKICEAKAQKALADKGLTSMLTEPPTEPAA